MNWPIYILEWFGIALLVACLFGRFCALFNRQSIEEAQDD